MVSFTSLRKCLTLLGAAVLLSVSARVAGQSHDGNEIQEFQIDNREARPLTWLLGWSEDFGDPFERFALLSYGWSASEQASVSARLSGQSVSRYKFLKTAGKRSSYQQLARIHLLAELRLREGPGNSGWPGAGQPDTPRWQTRHLCNAVRLNREWLLSSAACVTPESEQAGLEAALDATDLAADDTPVAAIDRTLRHPGGDLVLLHLNPASGLPDPGALNWGAEPLHSEDIPQLLSWGRTRPKPGLPPTLFRHIELRVTEPDLCDLSALESQYLCLTREGARLCPGDDGSPVFVVERDGMVKLHGMVALRNDQCVVAGTGALRQLPIVNLARHRAWIEAAIAPQPAATD
jgi:hypothetical protein